MAQPHIVLYHYLQVHIVAVRFRMSAATTCAAKTSRFFRSLQKIVIVDHGHHHQSRPHGVNGCSLSVRAPAPVWYVLHYQYLKRM